MDPAETIALPSAPAAPTRGSLPLVAAIVPLVSGIVLFVVTGSPLSLCFAALGPVMILGSFLDGLRQRRRAARRTRAEESRAWAQVERTLVEREEAERARRLRSAPDLTACLADPPTRPLALADPAEISVGRGDGPSPLRFSGAGERADAFRARHRTVPGVPVTARLADGLCVRGPVPIATAVARALVLQLCLRHASGAIRLDGDGVVMLGLEALTRTGGGGHDADLVHIGVGRTAPAGPRLYMLEPGAPAPAGYHAVLDVTEPGAARLRTREGSQDCAAEGISREQAAELVRELVLERSAEAAIPAAVTLAEVLAPSVPGTIPGDASGDGLDAALGRDAGGTVRVDLVADGPHALVTGVTGAGKSELLGSWVSALAATHSPEQVAFVLADFKGGTAFEPLRALPHVAAVITDLDADGAERGVRSLRAELRRRERILGERGARSVADAGDVLGRLVIVVDEFAALLQEHPDLAAVFTDIAARGRALGMHLILGTQRATGVIRDALAANCPLRIALRVTDAADSRAMIGTDAAAALPGDADGRGLAYLRRARDAAPALFRIARTRPAELEAIAARHPSAPRARSPWMPALPNLLRRADLPAVGAGEVLLGLADQPERQRQVARTLRLGEDRGIAVFGGPGSGKSALLRGVVEQVPGARLLPADPEGAWSLIDDLAEGRCAPPRLLAVDDADRHLAAFPLEYASAWAERLQRVLRIMADSGGAALLSASRCTAQVSALADLLPERALLRMASRTEHLTAGGAPDSYDPARPAGRARFLDGEVQLAMPMAERPDDRGDGEVTPLWRPRSGLIGVLSPAPARTAEVLAARFGPAVVQVLAEGAPVIVPDRGRDPAELMLLLGDAESWQRQYALWQRILRGGEAVVLAEAARELRTLAGVREIPPYAVPYAGRAWTVDEDGRPSRVLLSAPRGGVSPAAPPAG